MREDKPMLQDQQSYMLTAVYAPCGSSSSSAERGVALLRAGFEAAMEAHEVRVSTDSTRRFLHSLPPSLLANH
jgi:hypothetical protein